MNENIYMIMSWIRFYFFLFRFFFISSVIFFDLEMTKLFFSSWISYDMIISLSKRPTRKIFSPLWSLNAFCRIVSNAGALNLDIFRIFFMFKQYSCMCIHFVFVYCVVGGNWFAQRTVLKPGRESFSTHRQPESVVETGQIIVHQWDVSMCVQMRLRLYSAHFS